MMDGFDDLDETAQKQILEHQVKLLKETIHNKIRRNIAMKLKSEDKQLEIAKESQTFADIESQLTETASRLFCKEEDDKLDARLAQLSGQVNQAREQLDQLNAQFKKKETTLKVERNRAECFEKRLAALQRQNKSLKEDRSNLLKSIRMTSNQQDN